MEFFIKKNATLPYLLIKLIKDGRSDFRKLLDLDNFVVKFSMKSGDDIRVLNKECTIKEIDGELYVSYQFTKKETKKIGTYFGQFSFFVDGKEFVLPLNTELVINIIDSFVSNNISSNSNDPYSIESACCNSDAIEEILLLATQNGQTIVTEGGDIIII